MTATFVIELDRIAEDHGASLDVTGEMPIGEIVVGSEHYEPVGPARVEVTVINTGTAYEAVGHARAVVRAQCSRCLRDFDLDLDGEVDAYFVEPAHADEVPEEQDSAPVDNGRIEVGPFIETALVVAIPFAPLHDPDCLGICPTCGADRNEEPCDCTEAPSKESPFSALGELLEGYGEEDGGS